MYCPNCSSVRNRVVRSKKSDDAVIRIRECLECGAVWPTREPVRFVCEECGGTEWTISEVEHDGPEKKIRKRTCRRCGEKQYTIERRLSVEYAA